VRRGARERGPTDLPSTEDLRHHWQDKRTPRTSTGCWPRPSRTRAGRTSSAGSLQSNRHVEIWRDLLTRGGAPGPHCRAAPRAPRRARTPIRLRIPAPADAARGSPR
jgi:hypothetical protein